MDAPKHESAKRAGPNLYLLGFMATGKTVLGRRIAARLGYRYIDADSEIELKEGMPIAEIFSKRGEDYFRNLEKKFMEGGHPAEGCVVSCGGGMCCREGMPELIKSKGVSVVLFSREDEILNRISSNGNRPLLNCENPREKIAELLKARTPYYMRSGVAIATDANLGLTEEHILRIYKAYKGNFAKPRGAAGASANQDA